MRPSGLVAEDERLGWAPWRSPSDTPAKEGWKSEPWPSITSQPPSVARRRQLLDRAGDEIGDDGVDRDALARDQDAGLARRPEIGGMPRARAPGQCQRA